MTKKGIQVAWKAIKKTARNTIKAFPSHWKNKVDIASQNTDLPAPPTKLSTIQGLFTPENLKGDFPVALSPANSEDNGMLENFYDLRRTKSVSTLWLYGSYQNLPFDVTKENYEIEGIGHTGTVCTLQQNEDQQERQDAIETSYANVVSNKELKPCETPFTENGEKTECRNTSTNGNENNVTAAPWEAVDMVGEDNVPEISKNGPISISTKEENLSNTSQEENGSSITQGVKAQDEQCYEPVQKAINKEDGYPYKSQDNVKTDITTQDRSAQKTVNDHNESDTFQNKNACSSDEAKKVSNELQTFQNQHTKTKYNDDSPVKLEVYDNASIPEIVSPAGSSHSDSSSITDDRISKVETTNENGLVTCMSMIGVVTVDGMNSKTNVDRKSSSNGKIEIRRSNQQMAVADNTEMSDRQKNKSGICKNPSVNNYFADKQQARYIESACEIELGEQIKDFESRRENGFDTCLEHTQELNSFEKTVMNTFPGGEVEMSEGYFDNETSEMSMVMTMKKTKQANTLQNNDLERRSKCETEHDSLAVDKSKTCNKADGSDLNAGRKRKSPLLALFPGKGLKTLCKVVTFWILLSPKGTMGARINPVFPGNDDLNYVQMLMDYWDIFGNGIIAIAHIANLYHFARRRGLPIGNELRNLFENRGNFPGNGQILPLPGAIAILPGGGGEGGGAGVGGAGVGGAVGRALPPRFDGIQVLRQERRANRFARMHPTRNQAGDTRVRRVLERREVQVTEETIQGNEPSEIVPSARGN